MTAEPIPIVPQDDGNFTTDATATVVLGECRCPGRPHDEDTAEVYLELPWDVLVDVGLLSAGDPVPTAMITRLRADRLDPIAAAVNAAYERAQAPLPNASGAPSRRSRRESASPNPTIRPRARHTR
jgi:hypothetical protein